jgi:hypothetical protein
VQVLGDWAWVTHVVMQGSRPGALALGPGAEAALLAVPASVEEEISVLVSPLSEGTASVGLASVGLASVGLASVGLAVEPSP